MTAVDSWGDIGSVYDVAGVCTLLGQEPSVVHRLTGDRELLALSTGAGQFICPAFQFTPCGSVIEGLGDVLLALEGAGLSGWTIASWLVSPDEDLGGRTPLSALEGGEIAEVLAIAERWAT